MQRAVAHELRYDDEVLVYVFKGVVQQDKGRRQRVNDVRNEQAPEAVNRKELMPEHLGNQALLAQRIDDGEPVGQGRHVLDLRTGGRTSAHMGHLRIERRALGDGLRRVVDVDGLLREEFPGDQTGGDLGHVGAPSHQHGAADAALAVEVHRPLHGVHGVLEEVMCGLFELRAGDADEAVLAVHGEDDGRLVHAGELNLQTGDGVLEPHVLLFRAGPLDAELPQDEPCESRVPVVASQMQIPLLGEDPVLHGRRVVLHDAHVQGPSPEVEDQDLLQTLVVSAEVLAVQVRYGGGHRLLEDAHVILLQAGYAADGVAYQAVVLGGHHLPAGDPHGGGDGHRLDLGTLVLAAPLGGGPDLPHEISEELLDDLPDGVRASAGGDRATEAGGVLADEGLHVADDVGLAEDGAGEALLAEELPVLALREHEQRGDSHPRRVLHDVADGDEPVHYGRGRVAGPEVYADDHFSSTPGYGSLDRIYAKTLIQ